MKALLALLAVLVLTFAPARYAQATSSLGFAAEGYSVDLEIGYVDRYVIASVGFSEPGHPAYRGVPRHRVRVVEFDPEQKRLVLRYTASDEAPGVPSFELVMIQSQATLVVDGRRIVSVANWEM